MFAIAYKDKDGKDFQGAPWIIDSFDDVNYAKTIAKDLVNRGYLNVTLFRKYTDDELITWDYVNENSVNF